MLAGFFFRMREGGLPVSLTEYLTLLESLEQGIGCGDVDSFYALARTCLVKDEAGYDRFDRIFAEYFRGVERVGEETAGIPEEWLRRQAELHLTEEERRRIESLGGWDELMKALRERLAEQRGRHQGGSKWIGTAGTSPFGAYGYHPEGIRIGQSGSRQRRAVKVWDRREFRDLDGERDLGTRNLKLALRRLRRFAREGAADELDLDETIRSTAERGGWLDVRMVPERRNAVKVLLFLDVGGSMDDHVDVCERLFSAARSEFKHLEHFYFHNFPYERLWKENRRRYDRFVPTPEMLRTFSRDYRAVFVGDASMSPFEIVQPGGSVEHWNEEAGEVWLGRILAAFPSSIWLNPEPERRWSFVPSIGMTRDLMEGRMFPLTLEGIDRGIRCLERPRRGTD